MHDHFFVFVLIPSSIWSFVIYDTLSCPAFRSTIDIIIIIIILLLLLSSVAVRVTWYLLIISTA